MNFKKHLIGLGLFLLIISGGWLSRGYFEQANHPSDEAMIANFYEHRARFQELINMLQEDREIDLLFVNEVIFTDSRVWPRECDSCFSKMRFDEYQEVTACLGKWRPYWVSQKNGVMRMPVSADYSENNRNNYSDKGYAYFPQELPGVVDSLNGIGFKTEGIFYKKIGDGWYLYQETGWTCTG